MTKKNCMHGRPQMEEFEPQNVNKVSAILIMMFRWKKFMTNHSTTKLIKNNKLDVQVSIR